MGNSKKLKLYKSFYPIVNTPEKLLNLLKKAFYLSLKGIESVTILIVYAKVKITTFTTQTT